MSAYKSREELFDHVDWEGGPAEFIFSCGLSPESLPEGTPAHIAQAVARLGTQAAADLKAFTGWLHGETEEPSGRAPAAPGTAPAGGRPE